MARNRDWIALAAALLGNLIILIYCGTYIAVAKGWQANHTAYTIARDDRWEPILVETEAHLKRQDADSAELKRQILEALRNQAELNRNQVEMTKNQAEILKLLKAR
jgi:threonine aldolase